MGKLWKIFLSANLWHEHIFCNFIVQTAKNNNNDNADNDYNLPNNDVVKNLIHLPFLTKANCCKWLNFSIHSEKQRRGSEQFSDTNISKSKENYSNRALFMHKSNIRLFRIIMRFSDSKHGKNSAIFQTTMRILK